MRRNITTIGPDKKSHTFEVVGYFADDAAVAAHVKKVLPGHKLVKSELAQPNLPQATDPDTTDPQPPAPATALAQPNPPPNDPPT